MPKKTKGEQLEKKKDELKVEVKDEVKAEAKTKNELEQKYKELEEQIKADKVSVPQIYAWFKEELERKEKEIQQLKNDNMLLFNTAMKAREHEFESITKHSITKYHTKSETKDRK